MISQTLNILIPVISIPISINGLTLEKYGELAIYQSIFLTGIAVIEYGFNLSGSRIISSSNSETIKEDNKHIFSKICYFYDVYVGGCCIFKNHDRVRCQCCCFGVFLVFDAKCQLLYAV